MVFDVLTIFPGMFSSPLSESLVKKALDKGVLEIRIRNLRDYAEDKHRMTDDYPYGGGAGMVMKPEPIFDAIEDILGTCDRSAFPAKTRVVLLSPQGRPFDQGCATELAEDVDHLILICGRYEGVDERVSEAIVTHEISIGDYVLSGGEPAALVVTDAVVRLLPNALGSDTSAINDSFSSGLLDYPHYTRPAEYRGMTVPEVLLSGDHAKVEEWRRKKALERTEARRKDLLNKKEE